jgi:hypothetical protein
MALAAGIAHHLNGRAAKLKVNEIKWTERGVGDARAFAFAEVQHFDVEGNRALWCRGEQLNVVDTLEHATSGIALCGTDAMTPNG